MARLDVLMQQRAEREREATLLAVYGGLEKGVARAGGELVGISVKFGEMDCLLTLRAQFPAGLMIGFVGGEDFSGVLRRAASESVRDGIKWRSDKYRDNGG